VWGLTRSNRREQLLFSTDVLNVAKLFQLVWTALFIVAGGRQCDAIRSETAIAEDILRAIFMLASISRIQ
jgi:hypothetical protein